MKNNMPFGLSKIPQLSKSKSSPNYKDQQPRPTLNGHVQSTDSTCKQKPQNLATVSNEFKKFIDPPRNNVQHVEENDIHFIDDNSDFGELLDEVSFPCLSVADEDWSENLFSGVEDEDPAIAGKLPHVFKDGFYRSETKMLPLEKELNAVVSFEKCKFDTNNLSSLDENYNKLGTDTVSKGVPTEVKLAEIEKERDCLLHEKTNWYKTENVLRKELHSAKSNLNDKIEELKIKNGLLDGKCFEVNQLHERLLGMEKNVWCTKTKEDTEEQLKKIVVYLKALDNHYIKNNKSFKEAVESVLFTDDELNVERKQSAQLVKSISVENDHLQLALSHTEKQLEEKLCFINDLERQYKTLLSELSTEKKNVHKLNLKARQLSLVNSKLESKYLDLQGVVEKQQSAQNAWTHSKHELIEKIKDLHSIVGQLQNRLTISNNEQSKTKNAITQLTEILNSGDDTSHPNFLDCLGSQSVLMAHWTCLKEKLESREDLTRACSKFKKDSEDAKRKLSKAVKEYSKSHSRLQQLRIKLERSEKSEKALKQELQKVEIQSTRENEEFEAKNQVLLAEYDKIANEMRIQIESLENQNQFLVAELENTKLITGKNRTLYTKNKDKYQHALNAYKEKHIQYKSIIAKLSKEKKELMNATNDLAAELVDMKETLETFKDGTHREMDNQQARHSQNISKIHNELSETKRNLMCLQQEYKEEMSSSYKYAGSIERTLKEMQLEVENNVSNELPTKRVFAKIKKLETLVGRLVEQTSVNQLHANISSSTMRDDWMNSTNKLSTPKKRSNILLSSDGVLNQTNDEVNHLKKVLSEKERQMTESTYPMKVIESQQQEIVLLLSQLDEKEAELNHLYENHLPDQQPNELPVSLTATQDKSRTFSLYNEKRDLCHSHHQASFEKNTPRNFQFTGRKSSSHNDHVKGCSSSNDHIKGCSSSNDHIKGCSSPVCIWKNPNKYLP